MNRWLITAVIIVLVVPSLLLAQSDEESLKLKAAAEAASTVIPKGGPRLIPKDVIIEGLRQGGEVTFESDSILFHYGLPKIKEESYRQVAEIAAALKEAASHPELSQVRHYFVDGHTCPIGSEAFNCRLSWARADAVVNELLKSGIPREKLEPRGYGLVYPAHSNDKEETRKLNRRVVLKADTPKMTETDRRVICRQEGATVTSRPEPTRQSERVLPPQEVPAAPAVADPADPKGKTSPRDESLPRGFKRQDLQAVPKTPFQGAEPGTQSVPEEKRESLPRGFLRVD